MTMADNARLREIAQRALALILHPHSEWNIIAREASTVRGLYTGYVMILAAIPAVAHLVGRLLFGFGIGAFRGVYHTSILGLVVGAVVGYLSSLAAVYGMGLIIDAMAPYFGGAKDRMQAMKLAAFFPTAAWLAGIFTLVPALGALRIVGLYSFYLLVVGLPRLMRVREDRALLYSFAVIMAAVVILLLISLSAGLLTGGMMY